MIIKSEVSVNGTEISFILVNECNSHEVDQELYVCGIQP